MSAMKKTVLPWVLFLLNIAVFGHAAWAQSANTMPIPQVESTTSHDTVTPVSETAPPTDNTEKGTAQLEATPAIPEYNKDYEKLDKLLHNKEYKDDYKLTDLRLRAQDGSLSKYSANFSMNLSGPSFGNPSAPDLPNPDHRVGNYSQKLSTTMQARYRLDSDHSVGFGTGTVFNHPLQGVDRTDMSTPFVNYNIANRVNGIQMLLSPGVSAATTPELQAVGQQASASLFASLVKDIGTSRFAVSLSSQASLGIYSRGYNPGYFAPGTVNNHQTRKVNNVVLQAGGGDGNSSQYSVSAGPGVKYHISDRADLVGGFNIPFYNPMSAENASVLLPNTPTANIGFGWAYDRDLYIGPGISTYPTIWSWNNTTVGVSMIFSVL